MQFRKLALCRPSDNIFTGNILRYVHLGPSVFFFPTKNNFVHTNRTVSRINFYFLEAGLACSLFSAILSFCHALELRDNIILPLVRRNNVSPLAFVFLILTGLQKDFDKGLQHQ